MQLRVIFIYRLHGGVFENRSHLQVKIKVLFDGGLAVRGPEMLNKLAVWGRIKVEKMFREILKNNLTLNGISIILTPVLSL